MSRAIEQCYREACRALAKIEVERPQTEALLLCGRFFGVNSRAELVLRSSSPADPERERAFFAAVASREHMPLQYILGEWEFDGLSLRVGEGVLVPREDTLALVEAVSDRLAGTTGKEEPRVLDLCAGSGAVALALARRFERLRCVCVELSDDAARYLDENIGLYGNGRVTRVKADVLRGPNADMLREAAKGGRFDVICSNPPYIPDGDVDQLAREVRQEPRMALSGGGDGLDFYRAITEKWLALAKPGGAVAVELGVDQSEEVARIFVRGGVGDIIHYRDFGGIIRAIIGTVGANAC